MEEIAFLTGASTRLVRDYLEVYQAALEAPHRREKLEEELARVAGRGVNGSQEEKGGLR